MWVLISCVNENNLIVLIHEHTQYSKKDFKMKVNHATICIHIKHVNHKNEMFNCKLFTNMLWKVLPSYDLAIYK